MKPNTKLLYQAWNDNKQYLSNRPVDLDQARLDEALANVFSNGPCYYYVVDFADMKISYMSPSVKVIHGLDPETTTFQDILNQIHPDDMEYVSKAENFAWDFYYNKIGPERYKNYKMSYCFRFRTVDGSYQLFNHQTLTLSIDENGRLSKSLNIHTNISHLTTTNTYKVSAIGMFGAPSYLNVSVLDDAALPEPAVPLFTKRETEIIRLMADGLSTKEIARHLFIAYDTATTHRKNIMVKSGCKNSVQLTRKCIVNGLL